MLTQALAAASGAAGHASDAFRALVDANLKPLGACSSLVCSHARNSESTSPEVELMKVGCGSWAFSTGIVRNNMQQRQPFAQNLMWQELKVYREGVSWWVATSLCYLSPLRVFTEQVATSLYQLYPQLVSATVQGYCSGYPPLHYVLPHSGLPFSCSLLIMQWERLIYGGIHPLTTGYPPRRLIEEKRKMQLLEHCEAKREVSTSWLYPAPRPEEARAPTLAVLRTRAGCCRSPSPRPGPRSPCRRPGRAVLSEHCGPPHEPPTPHSCAPAACGGPGLPWRPSRRRGACRSLPPAASLQP